MSLAKQKSWEIINQYHTNDPYVLAEIEHIDVIEHDLTGRLKELYFGDHIVLNKKMSLFDKRHYLSHALGHHYLHAGNYLFFTQNRYLQNFKEEQQAEEFAAFLLVPDQKLIPVIHLDISELADNFQLSPEFIQFRISLCT